MAITAISAWPARNDPDFNSKAETVMWQLPTFVTEMNAAATLAQLTTTTTSSSSVLIGTGAKTFTVPAGLGFAVGMTLRIANSSTNYMTGDVTSYSSTTLVVNVTAVVGSGTLASWKISLSAVGASTAATVSNTPAGNIAATTVQAAINELDSEKLSSAAGAVTDTNLNSIITAGSVGDSANIPVVTYTAKGRISGVSTTPKITLGTVQNSTSGTSIDFTSIPNNVKRITILFNGVSTSGNSLVQIQIGSTTFTTTGYVSGSSYVGSGGSTVFTSSTTGFVIQPNGASSSRNGAITLHNISGNAWIESHVIADVSSIVCAHGAGAITLGGVLDRVRITTVNGTDTFDSGSINIMWE